MPTKPLKNVQNAPVYPPPNPQVATIMVAYHDGALVFTEAIGGSRSVSCQPSGQITVLLQETVGYTQRIFLAADSEILQFEGFRAGKEKHWIRNGKVPGTPFEVHFWGGDRLVGCVLLNRYEGPSSLASFPYELSFRHGGSRPMLHDPQIHNQGMSGPPGKSRILSLD